MPTYKFNMVCDDMDKLIMCKNLIIESKEQLISYYT